MHSSKKTTEKGSKRENQMQANLNGVQDSTEAVPYYSELDFSQEESNIAEANLLLYDEVQFLVQFGALDDLYINIVSPPFQACMHDLATFSSYEPRDSQSNEERRPYAIPGVSLEILRHFRSRVGEKRDGEKGQRASPTTLSVNHMIDLAVGKFIHTNSGSGKNLSASINHSYTTALSSLSKGDSEDVQLLQNLLSCAEEVSNHHYDCASELLQELSKLSSSPVNAIQRLVYYFADSLREKVELEKGLLVNPRPLEFIPPISDTATFLEKLPFNQVMLFAGIQAILDHVVSRRKVHVIDLGLHCGGLRHAVLMQALAAAFECSLEHLKITTVVTQPNLRLIEEAGIRLQNMAKSLNLSFSFHVISLDEILDPHQTVLSLEHEETVVVQATHSLRFMIPKPSQLENLMNIIRSINPHVMIITEVEARIDSPVFVNRFIEALSFFGAGFDYVENFLRNDSTGRDIIESKLFSPSIKNLIAAEEKERKFRIVGINMWREILARFGMVETGLGKLALSHANYMLKMFECQDSCKLGLNGNSLIVGWKDTPIYSLSAWKFQEM